MSVFCIYYRSVHVKFSIPIFSLGDISHQSIIDTMADIHQNVFFLEILASVLRRGSYPLTMYFHFQTCVCRICNAIRIEYTERQIEYICGY